MSIFLDALARAGELLNLANLGCESDIRIDYIARFGKFIDIGGLGLFCSYWHPNIVYAQATILFMSNILFLLNSPLDYEQNPRFLQQLPPPLLSFIEIYFCYFLVISCV